MRGWASSAWSWSVIAALSLLLLVPAPALALCPNCLGQNRSLTPTLQLVGAFLLVPFVVALVVSRFIRRALRQR